MSINFDQPITLSLNTPLFSYNADQKTPQFRAASVRGQLRQWMNWLGYSQDMVNKLFGCADERQVKPSRVIVRTDYTQAQQGKYLPLPHPGHKNTRQALCESENTLHLHISFRKAPKMQAISKDSAEYKALQHCVEAWLLMGSIGLRSTRGAGSISCDSLPCMKTPQTYLKRCRELLAPHGNVAPKIKVALFDEIYDDGESARIDVSDTLKENVFQNCGRPLGGIESRLGGRKTSDLKFKILYFDNNQEFRILCIKPNNLSNNYYNECANILNNSNKYLGQLLKSANFE